MVLMIIGSTLSAAAQDWPMLLFGRAIQGLSGAGIASSISIVLSDKVSLKDNAVNNTIFQLTASSAYAYGPVIGGYLTKASWRWVFVLSIPIAVLANVIIFFILRKELVKGTHSIRHSFLSGLTTFDMGGTFIFITGITLIILATTWGGSTYPWSSAAVLTPLVIGGVLFAIFPVYEYLLEPGKLLSSWFPNQSAMIPFALFERLDVLLVSIIQFASGTSLYSVFYFISIYFTLVEGYDAGKSGTQLLYYIPGLGVGAYIAMFMCNYFPASTFWPLFLGTIVETVGIGMIAYATNIKHVPLICGMMGLAGAGTGMRFMPATLHITGIWPTRRAAALSLMRFALPFGGTIGLAIMGYVYNNKMAKYSSMASTSSVGIGGGFGGGKDSASVTIIDNLPPAERDAIREAAKEAVKWAFIAILPILGLSNIASLFLGNVYIKSTKKTSTGTSQTATQQVTTANTGAIPKKQGELYIVYGIRWLIVRGIRLAQNKSKSQKQESDAITSTPTELPAVDLEKAPTPMSGDETEGPAEEQAPASHVLYEPFLLALFRGKAYLESRKEKWSLD